jgi:hypothetical protein
MFDKRSTLIHAFGLNFATSFSTLKGVRVAPELWVGDVLALLAAAVR